jgi:predicted lactoylglutathione lyase
MAATREAVDGFYTASIAAGARDNISPPIRHEYDAMCYTADILDPDGYSVEAVIKD